LPLEAEEYLLTSEEMEEKDRLMSLAFTEWKKTEFVKFYNALERFGVKAY